MFIQSMFVDVETMSGNNRYECASCRRLTDATKGMKIRSLPSIFTVSLLRFSYDLINFQRFKVKRQKMCEIDAGAQLVSKALLSRLLALGILQGFGGSDGRSWRFSNSSCNIFFGVNLTYDFAYGKYT